MIINTLKKKLFLKSILKFIYYLRYLLIILVIFIILIFTLPKLFKHVDKIDALNNILKNQYGFNIKKMAKVKYKILPTPNLEITNPVITIDGQYPDIQFKNLRVYIDLKGLYRSDKISLKKMTFKGNYLGNNISGNFTQKKNTNLLNIKVEDFGIKTKVYFDKNKKFPKPSGLMQIKILGDTLLINFDYDKNLKFTDTIYKSKNIHTVLTGELNFEPYFYFNILANIKKINLDKLKIKNTYQIIINEISNYKLNGELVINYLNKKILNKKSEINKINLSFNNGDIILKNSNITFANLNIRSNFYLKKYPTYKELEYKLIIQTEDINKFFNVLELKKQKNLKQINAVINGKINLDANKYYFDEIKINSKKINEKKLVKIKSYLDNHSINLYSVDLNKKNIYLFIKNLFNFI